MYIRIGPVIDLINGVISGRRDIDKRCVLLGHWQLFPERVDDRELRLGNNVQELSALVISKQAVQQEVVGVSVQTGQVGAGTIKKRT